MRSYMCLPPEADVVADKLALNPLFPGRGYIEGEYYVYYIKRRPDHIVGPQTALVDGVAIGSR